MVLNACVPKTLTPSIPAVQTNTAPTVQVDYPTDARPASERRGGSFHLSAIPLAQLNYGAYNLRPGVLPLLDRTIRKGLAAGAPSSTDLSVDVWVLHHAVRRDRSDAHWVSTLTGGIAGTVGRFIYPEVFEAEALVRLRFRRGDHTLVVRDIEAAALRSMLVAKTWGAWSLYRRSPSGEAMTEVIERLHHDLEAQISSLTREVLAGGPITTGRPPTLVAQHALQERWDLPDSIRPSSSRSLLLDKKFAGPTFSVVSGQVIHRGEVIGRIGLPLDTLGYDIALRDDTQVLIDVTLLGLYNSATVGLRWQALAVDDLRLVVEGRVGGYLAVQTRPLGLILAGTRASLGLIGSIRPKNTTWFVRISPNTLAVREPVDAFTTLTQGNVVGISLAPGAEVQLSHTVALSVQLAFIAQYQGGEALTHGIGPFLPLPQVALGFR